MFSNQSNISFLFLQKIAKSLREADLIISAKGKKGGYKLIKPISSINLKEVIEAVEGQYGVVNCTKSCHCERSKICNLKNGLNKVNQQITQYMESLKISDLH